MSDATTGRKFPLGRLTATRAVMDEIPEYEIFDACRRHLAGDWGDVSQADQRANDLALMNGDRLFSAYKAAAGKFYIITEADRSITTVMLPEEY